MAVNASNLVNFGTNNLSIGDWTQSAYRLSAPTYLPLNNATTQYATASYVTLAALINNPTYSWVVTQVTTPGFSFGDGTYFAGKFLFFNSAQSVTIYNSTTGASWTGTSMPSQGIWKGFATDGTTLVAVQQANSTPAATNVAATSTNGTTWTARTLPSTQSWSKVVYGAGLFVAIANNGTTSYATSPDGTTWTARTLPNGVDHIVFGNGVFVANIQAGSSAYYTSTDGINWTTRVLPAVGYIYGSVFGNGKFLLQQGGTTLYTGTDGINWITGNGYVSTTRPYCFGNNTFVALPDSSASSFVYTSTDGMFFTQRSNGFGAIWSVAVYGASNWVFGPGNTAGAYDVATVVSASLGTFTLPQITPATGSLAYIKAT